MQSGHALFREIFLLLAGEEALEVFTSFPHVRCLCSPPLVAKFVLQRIFSLKASIRANHYPQLGNFFLLQRNGYAYNQGRHGETAQEYSRFGIGTPSMVEGAQERES
jgi:hypothetical protein